MSIWQKLFSTREIQNFDKNHTACVTNDCLRKSNEQLIQTLKATRDACVLKGIKRVLMSRGYSKKELDSIQHSVQ